MTDVELHLTKCRLCGKAPTALEGLCADCCRALTRARQGSAALRSAPAAGARKPKAVDRIVLTSPVEPEPEQRSGRGRVVVWAAIAGVVGMLALVLAAGLSPPRIVEPKVAERVTRVVPPLIEPANEDEATEAERDAIPPAPKKAGLDADAPSLSKDSTRTLSTRMVRNATNASTAARTSSSDKSGADAARANGYIDPPVAEPPVQQARASVAPSVANVDDAQVLTSALEKCTGEKFLAGVICEQKARLRYCEGKWGQVPQCTAKPRAD